MQVPQDVLSSFDLVDYCYRASYIKQGESAGWIILIHMSRSMCEKVLRRVELWS